jgi:hypothetical protein
MARALGARHQKVPDADDWKTNWHKSDTSPAGRYELGLWRSRAAVSGWDFRVRANFGCPSQVSVDLFSLDTSPQERRLFSSIP